MQRFAKAISIASAPYNFSFVKMKNYLLYRVQILAFLSLMNKKNKKHKKTAENVLFLTNI